MSMSDIQFNRFSLCDRRMTDMSLYVRPSVCPCGLLLGLFHCAVYSVSEPSDPDEEVNAEGGRDVQRLQAESRRREREEDGEHLFGVHQELRRIVPFLKNILDAQINRVEQ